MIKCYWFGHPFTGETYDKGQIEVANEIEFAEWMQNHCEEIAEEHKTTEIVCTYSDAKEEGNK